MSDQYTSVVIVERISDHQPSYPVHGKTCCVRCENWCWLSGRALKALQDGEAKSVPDDKTLLPLCVECSIELAAAGQITRKPAGYLNCRGREMRRRPWRR